MLDQSQIEPALTAIMSHVPNEKDTSQKKHREPIPGSAADPDDIALAKILDGYLAARRQTYRTQVGKHWNIFRPDFDRLLRSKSILSRFRRFGISYYFDATIRQGSAENFRNSSNTKPALRGHTGEFVEAWIFDEQLLKNKIMQTVASAPLLITAKNIKLLGEPIVGDPPGIFFRDLEGVCDFQDLRHVYHAVRVLDVCGEESPERIIEIGSGYGGLPAKLRRLYPTTQIILVDLPETLSLQHWYLRTLYPETRIIGFDDVVKGWNSFDSKDYDFLLLPPNAINLVRSSSCDLAININSFTEMTSGFIKYYIDELERVVKQKATFYCVNRIRKTTSGEEIRLDDYPFDSQWDTEYLDSIPWQESIIELVLKRAA